MFNSIRGLIVLVFCVLSSSALAKNSQLSLSYDVPTRISLSAEHVNRIHFAGKRIKKIVGDTSQYNVVLSDNHKDMFVQLNVERGEVIHISVIDIAGKVMDLEIGVISSKYPSIVTLVSDDAESLSLLDEEKEIKAMMQAMQNNLKGKYYTLWGGSKFNCAALGKDMNCQIIADYRFGNYRGVGLRIKNKGKVPAMLDLDIVEKTLPLKILKQSPSSLFLNKGDEKIIYFVSKTEVSND